jgi:MoaA/NifB/PqqE/SkfB family radical SAM enzyme
MSLRVPRKVRLETSSRCQLKCPACPTATKAIDAAVGSGVLKFADFKQFVLDNPQVETIEISNYGEVFLNPELVRILRFANEKGVAISMANGVNLNHATEEILEALVLYRVTEITCSIDGASQESYAQYRVRGDYERVIGHIRRINHFKSVHQSKHPHLRWQFIVFGHNEHEIALARERARELEMEIYFKLSWDSDFSPIRDVEGVKKELGVAHVTREAFTEATGSDYMHRICHQLWTEPQINWDGKNLGCCRNFWGDFGGNAFKDGLAATLNHEKMTHARGMLLGKKPPRQDIPCTTCGIYQQMRKTKKWIESESRFRSFFRKLEHKVRSEVRAGKRRMVRAGKGVSPAERS